MNPFLTVFGSQAKRDGSVPEMNIRSDLGRPGSLKIEGTGSSPTVVVSSPSYHLLRQRRPSSSSSQPRLLPPWHRQRWDLDPQPRSGMALAPRSAMTQSSRTATDEIRMSGHGSPMQRRWCRKGRATIGSGGSRGGRHRGGRWWWCNGRA